MKTLATMICFLAVLAMRCMMCAAGPVPDLIYFHGKVYTVDDALGVQSAFAVQGDRIVAVGSDAQVLALAGKGTRRIDLEEAAVIPGLWDSHDHFWNVGVFLIRGVDLVGVSSRTELESRLKAAVGQAKPGETVYTTIGWAVQPALTRADLDKISETAPIVLIADRRGRSLANSAALKRLGISRQNPTFHGSPVPVDKNGEPTGEPPDYPLSVDFVLELIPPFTPAEKDKVVAQAEQQRQALGITSVRELSVWPEELAVLERMRRQGKLTLRIVLGVEFPEQKDLASFIAKQAPLQHNDPWLFVDSLSEEPWAPGSTTQEKFTELIRAENLAGWRPAPHVSSDSHRGITADVATEDALAAYEAANRDNPVQGKRWYIEHVPFATPAQIDRMAALGLIVSTQSAGFDLPAIAPLPPERMAHWNPIREFIDHKLVVIGGSDYNGPNPVTHDPNNPFIPFYFYVTRRTRSGQVETPSEQISRQEALRIFTANPAYATFQDSIKGRIAPGLLADFVILNQDVMSVPDDKILETHPLATFVGGKKVYTAPGARF